MAYDIGPIKDQISVLSDFRSPGVATELRNVASGTVSIFQHSCSVGTPYYITSNDAGFYYTLNGATPSLAAGSGTNLGIPVSQGAKEIFVPTTGLNVVKVLSTANCTVVLGKLSLSSSL